MGSLACVFSVLRVSGQLVGSPDPFKPGLGFTTLGQKKVAPQTPLRPGLGLQPIREERGEITSGYAR